MQDPLELFALLGKNDFFLNIILTWMWFNIGGSNNLHYSYTQK